MGQQEGAVPGEKAEADDVPKGLPTSDRHHSEKAAEKDGGDASVGKHRYKESE
jgi:hypothetical protein